MAKTLVGWYDKGFARSPELKVAPATGLTVYRCWGGGSKIDGRYYSLVKPASVGDAEDSFNIAIHGNRIFAVSTFKLAAGVEYWEGPVLHYRKNPIGRQAQIFVDLPFPNHKVVLVSTHPIQQDVFTALGNTKEFPS